MKPGICLLSFLVIALTAFFTADPVSAQPETMYVFVNVNVPDNTLTQSDLQNIYLGKKEKWGNSQSINFTALNSGTCQENFIKQFVERTPFQFQNYWKKQIFTGKGQPPRGFDSETSLIDYVSRTSGAIGYSCSPPDSGKVKILTIN